LASQFYVGRVIPSELVPSSPSRQVEARTVHIGHARPRSAVLQRFVGRRDYGVCPLLGLSVGASSSNRLSEYATGMRAWEAPDPRPAARGAAGAVGGAAWRRLGHAPQGGRQRRTLLRADGTMTWSLMQLERRLRPEAFDRRRGGYIDRRRTQPEATNGSCRWLFVRCRAHSTVVGRRATWGCATMIRSHHRCCPGEVAARGRLRRAVPQCLLNCRGGRMVPRGSPSTLPLTLYCQTHSVLTRFRE
jgi:hypothetical protein